MADPEDNIGGEEDASNEDENLNDIETDTYMVETSAQKQVRNSP